MKETQIKVSKYRRCKLPSCSIPCNTMYKKTKKKKNNHRSKAIFNKKKKKKLEIAKIKNKNSHNLSNLNPKS